VRPAIEQAIIKELNPSFSASASQQDNLTEPAPPMVTSTSSHSTRPVTPGVPDNGPEPVEPLYVNTSRELDDMLRDMQLYFEGKETEQNWMKREESITTLRRILAGNSPSDFGDQLLAGLRALLDGIIKAVTSLRTSLSKEGCSLVQDIARVYGPGMDPMVELLMQTFVKLTAATKKISSQLANTTVDIIISKVTYNYRLVQHISFACQDKNAQPRLYACGWLKTLLNKEAHHKNHVEHTGGLEVIEKCIKKGLSDANPGVRERMRGTYWTFAAIWPARAEAIMNGLDSTAQRLLQNDPNNPNSPKRLDGPVRPGMGLSKSTMGSSKSNLRETMQAQKRSMATVSSKEIPKTRPGSAMSRFSPGPTLSSSQAMGATRVRPEPSIMASTGGLSGAPVRPVKRKPEAVPRPATAGPYSVRGHDQSSVEQHSPPDTRQRPVAVTPKPVQSPPERTTHKSVRPFQLPESAEARIPTPTRPGTPKGFTSPRLSPSRSLSSMVPPPVSGQSRAHDDLAVGLSENPSAPQPGIPQSPGAGEPMALSPAPAITASRIPRPSSTSPTSPPRSAHRSAPLQLGSPLRFSEPSLPSQPRSLEVYEDPFTAERVASPKPAFPVPVLEDKPVNQDAALLQQASRRRQEGDADCEEPSSPEKTKLNLRLLDSGIAKVQQLALDVHGFRKLQGILRESCKPTTTTPRLLTDDKFNALVTALFSFLEAPLPSLSPEKASDVKTQVLATIKLLLKRMRPSFQPHVSRGLESLVRVRASYDTRTHIVSGLELLAQDLAALGDASEIILVLSRLLSELDVDDPVAGRSLSMGLHVLAQMIDDRLRQASTAAPDHTFVLADPELDALASLAAKCLDSMESAVRMDAVALCVALHAVVGDAKFWQAVKGVREDPKSLITYYIVKRQREMGTLVG